MKNNRDDIDEKILNKMAPNNCNEDSSDAESVDSFVELSKEEEKKLNFKEQIAY
jgi:hypothetical protein